MAAALVALWVTFAPCFLWIFAGAPYVGRIGAQARLTAALNAITAAAVGVILNLSLWFALNVFFGTVARAAFGPVQLWIPDLASILPVAVLLAVLAACLLICRRLDMLLILPIMAVAGLGASLVF